MSLILNQKKFYLTLLGGALVVAGVWMKNGLASQGGEANMKHLGAFTFLAGWAVVAWALVSNGNLNLFQGIKSKKGIVALIASGIIVTSVMIMMNAKDKGQQPPKLAGIGFIVGWIMLGISVGLGGAVGGFKLNRFFQNKSTWFGLLASLLVVVSMVKVLPSERKRGITDSMGMAMFTAAWGSLAVGNALTGQGALNVPRFLRGF